MHLLRAKEKNRSCTINLTLLYNFAFFPVKNCFVVVVVSERVVCFDHLETFSF